MTPKTKQSILDMEPSNTRNRGQGSTCSIIGNGAIEAYAYKVDGELRLVLRGYNKESFADRSKVHAAGFFTKPVLVSKQEGTIAGERCQQRTYREGA